MACMVPLMLQGREEIAKTEKSPESRGIATESRGIGKTRPLEFVQLADHACTPQPMTAMTRDYGDSFFGLIACHCSSVRISPRPLNSLAPLSHSPPSITI